MDRHDAPTAVSLQRWSDEDFAVLERSNTPEMTRFLGGPESDDKLRDRHARYLRYWQTGEACMFRIATPDAPEGVGAIGYWKTSWQGAEVYETGWGIDTAHQGRGLAKQAVIACLAHAAEHGNRRLVYAFPRVDNDASNALCRTVGFVNRGEHPFEYPARNPIRCIAWAYDLRATSAR